MGFRGLSVAPALIPATKDLIRSIFIDDSGREPELTLRENA
jgi:hypothetical protein